MKLFNKTIISTSEYESLKRAEEITNRTYYLHWLSEWGWFTKHLQSYMKGHISISECRDKIRKSEVEVAELSTQKIYDLNELICKLEKENRLLREAFKTLKEK